MSNIYDVIVIGGGHAGAEAAAAAARLGCRTLLVTVGLDAIGRMSCNPAIGGLGKGQIVREIDALGGLMAGVTDATGIQFRMLNRGKGPAVWAPRAQADRELYSEALRRCLESTPNLDLVDGIVGAIDAEPSGHHSPPFESTEAKDGGASRLCVRGVRLEDGRDFRASAIVLTTGTFLRGLMHCGTDQTPGGRIGEQAADQLSGSLERLGLRLGRLKTGTPPRVHRDTVDFDRAEAQPGDMPPAPFSFMTDRIDQPQVNCWVTYTNQLTHDMIRANLDRAPLFSGQIQGRGPRYCPSIEDKVVRFADRDRHQVFLEPEGRGSERIYCNGLATSLPKDVQEDMVHSVPGLERARILQYGYAIEYDWVPTDQINATLEAKTIAGLFLAGQINGTSGYEEAAGQGLLAGINAVAKVRGADPLILGRDEAYIGVMIDDLVTKPPVEPYRMFTSRAEYRLQLRSDNADERLTPIGRTVGLVDDARWQRFEQKRDQVAAIEAWLETTRSRGLSLREWLRRPEVRIASLVAEHGASLDGVLPEALEQAEIRTKYEGYIERQTKQIARFRQTESVRIPADLDYRSVPSLRAEARERFTQILPRTLGQAGRISGISPADLSVLYLHLRQRVQSKRP